MDTATCGDRLIRCWWCDKEFAKGELRLVREGRGRDVLLCEQCLKEFGECDDCRRLFPEAALKTTDGGERICHSCNKERMIRKIRNGGLVDKVGIPSIRYNSPAIEIRQIKQAWKKQARRR